MAFAQSSANIIVLGRQNAWAKHGRQCSWVSCRCDIVPAGSQCHKPTGGDSERHKCDYDVINTRCAPSIILLALCFDLLLKMHT